MFKQKKLGKAVALAIATNTIGYVAHAAQVEEVIVTATKRSASVQDVAVAVQAMGEEKLDELGVENFDDYIQFLPGVNSGGRGPGQSSIYIRGMATDNSNQSTIEFGAPVPNVALYLDEQPVGSGGRNLDVYAADMNRVEVLPGPQGTVFGASSQAGTVRLITNKPVMDEFSGGIDVGYGTTKGGADSQSFEGHINIPVSDRLAVRAVAYRAVQGGYIDNVLGTRDLADSAGFPAGATSTPIDNADLVEDDFNEARYTGFRLSGKFLINDDWDVLLQYLNQELEVDGVFDHSPSEIDELEALVGGAASGEVVGDLKVRRFFEDSLDDEFDQFAVTVNGRIGALNLVYAGSYLDRDVTNVFDYISYSFAGFGGVGAGYYYFCTTLDATAVCGDPSLATMSFITNERETHELRISSDFDGPVNFLAGIFYDDIKTEVDSNFFGPAAAGIHAPNSPLAGSTMVNPNVRMPGVLFINDITRTEKQLSFFGEINVQIIPDLFSATLGMRHYDIETELLGSSSFSNRIDQSPDGSDLEFGRNLDQIFADALPLEEQDNIFKVTLELTPNEDVLLYATYSEGFRPGGFNRVNIPEAQTYVSDTVENYEFGWKTTLLDGTLQFNGALYYVDWSDLQVAVTDLNISPLTFTLNVADAEIRGLETDVIYNVTDNLTLFAALSYNDTELVDVPPNIVGLAPEGSELALAPKYQFNIRGRYEWEYKNMSPYVQVVYSYTDDSFSSTTANNRFPQESYDLVNASIGAKIGESWSVELYGENLTDERAQLFVNTLDTDLRITTNRPRSFGLRVSYDFGN